LPIICRDYLVFEADGFGDAAGLPAIFFV